MAIVDTSAAFLRAANIIALDYPYEAAIASALAICDHAVMVVGQSEDGTREAIRCLQRRYGERLRVREETIIYDRGWQERWWDVCREMTDAEWQLWLDLDEVIDPARVPAIRALMADPTVTLVRFPFVHLYATPAWREQGGFLTHNTRLGRRSAGYRMRNWCTDATPKHSACAAVVLVDGVERNAHAPGRPGLVDAPTPILHYGWCRLARALAISQAKHHAWYADGGGLADGRLPVVADHDYRLGHMIASGRVVPYRDGHPPIMRRWMEAHIEEWATLDTRARQELGR